MHAVIGDVAIDAGEGDEAGQILRDVVVPWARNAPGLVAAYFVRSEDGTRGRSILLFDTEEAARDAIEAAMSAVPLASVGPVRVAIWDVLAQA
jgi:hypothetical protein